MHKRQLNSFLANLGIKQLFWSNVRRRCQQAREDYKEVTTHLCTHRFDAICSAFLWDPKKYPYKPGLPWDTVHHLWHDYCKKHNFC
jgi:hypothetical protein